MTGQTEQQGHIKIHSERQRERTSQKNSISSIFPDVPFLLFSEGQQHRKGSGDKPDKILQRQGVHMWKGKEDFANTGSDTEDGMYSIVLEVQEEEM